MMQDTQAEPAAVILPAQDLEVVAELVDILESVAPEEVIMGLVVMAQEAEEAEADLLQAMVEAKAEVWVF